MKTTKVLTGLGFFLVIFGGMLGDYKSILPCFACIIAGSALVAIAIKKENKNEEAAI